MSLFEHTRRIAERYLDALPDLRVGASTDLDAMRAALDRPLPETGEDPETVLTELAHDLEPGLVQTAGPRYYGFVIGGAYPVSVAADWLTATWDNPNGLFTVSPGTAVLEQVVARWVLELLELPGSASVGFVSGCHMANFTAIAAARHEVLRRVDWDVEAQGIRDAPEITIVVGDEAHASIFGVLRLLGFGADHAVRVAVDDQGRMDSRSLDDAITSVDGPLIVIAQAGNVNSGAFDPLDEIAPIVHDRGGWLHVDGAFGLWARASRKRARLAKGAELADSWATDAHKWLNVPYDSGIVAIAHPASHTAAMSLTASYLIPGEGDNRNGQDWVPELSRRNRAIPLYATLRALGRDAVEDLVDRCCDLATRIAGRLDGEQGARVTNDVVLNQVLVHFGSDDRTRAIIDGVQADGTCWLAGATWQGDYVMRISISNWATDEEDIDRSADAILRVAAATP